MESPKAAARRLLKFLIMKGYTPAGLFTYVDRDGNAIYHKARLDPPTSDLKKELRPFHMNGAGYTLGEPEFASGKKPLYGLQLLAQRPDEAVWFCEGEGCAHALLALGLVAVTAGSASSDDKVDLEPLRNRTVVTWPDNNKVGRDHMSRIALRLVTEGDAKVHSVNIDVVESLPDGGDCVDWLALHPGSTKADVEALIAKVMYRGARSQPLDQIEQFLRRFVSYPSCHACVAHVLWIAHTHLMEVWDSTPRIAFLSPEPGSGKSRALEATELLVPNPVEAINVSPAYLFRKVGSIEGRPTVLYDEIDTIFGPKAKENEEIRGLLNAGHRKHGIAGRCVMRGGEVHTEELSAYCAVALAGLGGLPDTILTRSIVVRMRRRGPSETVEPFRRRLEERAGHELRDELIAWCSSIESAVNKINPAMPSGIRDRDADVWEALLMIADAAGGEWPQRARAAAVALVSEAKASTPSLGVRLLADLKSVFGDRTAMSTEEILKALCAIEEAPWSDLKGKSLNDIGLANRLKPYGIKSERIDLENGQRLRGYRRALLVDAWQRYLCVGVNPVQPVPPVQAEELSRTHWTARTDLTATDSQNTSITYCTHWLLRYRGKEPGDVYFANAVDLTEVLAEYPEAIAAEPLVG